MNASHYGFSDGSGVCPIDLASDGSRDWTRYGSSDGIRVSRDTVQN